MLTSAEAGRVLEMLAEKLGRDLSPEVIDAYTEHFNERNLLIGQLVVGTKWIVANYDKSWWPSAEQIVIAAKGRWLELHPPTPQPARAQPEFMDRAALHELEVKGWAIENPERAAEIRADIIREFAPRMKTNPVLYGAARETSLIMAGWRAMTAQRSGRPEPKPGNIDSILRARREPR